MNEVQKLKFYQKGTLTVGNRLVSLLHSVFVGACFVPRSLL